MKRFVEVIDRMRGKDKDKAKKQKELMKVLFKAVTEEVKQLHGLTRATRDQWFEEFAKEIYPLIRGDLKLERRAEFEMKRFLATMRAGREAQSSNQSDYVPNHESWPLSAKRPQPPSVLKRSGFFREEWSSEAIRARIQDREGIPSWVDDPQYPIQERSFEWDPEKQRCVYPVLDLRLRSLVKEGYRINGRHAALLKVDTFGPHRLGGQRF